MPTILALIQGIGGEAICDNNAQPKFSEPRFSVSVFMFLLAGIIMCSLIAFVILEWSSVVKVADALEKEVSIILIVLADQM